MKCEIETQCRWAWVFVAAVAGITIWHTRHLRSSQSARDARRIFRSWRHHLRCDGYNWTLWTNVSPVKRSSSCIVRVKRERFLPLSAELCYIFLNFCSCSCCCNCNCACFLQLNGSFSRSWCDLSRSAGRTPGGRYSCKSCDVNYRRTIDRCAGWLFKVDYSY